MDNYARQKPEMSEGARSMTVRPAHPSSETQRRSRYARAICLGLVCLGVGVLAGSVAAGSIAGRSPHQDGACMALRMAAAYGYLDERQQRVVMRALATATNTEAHLFPGGYRGIRQACGLVADQGS